MAEEPQNDASLPPGWTVVASDSAAPAAAPELPTGFLERLHDALGAGIRGAGDVTGANWLLEHSGLVPDGRLSGPEQNDRDEQTRASTGFGTGLMLTLDAVPETVDALHKLLTPSNLATALEVAMHPQKAADQAVRWLRAPASATTVGKVAGKAPSLEESLMQALNDVRDGQPPTSVSLPGGGTSRAASAAEAVTGPNRMGAWSSEVLPESAARSGGPARLRTPAPRVPPRLVLQPGEAQAADQLQKALKPTASLRGMKAAAGVRPEDLGPASLDELISQLKQKVH